MQNARRNALAPASKTYRNTEPEQTTVVEADLVADCQRGDRDAQRRLYEQYHAQVHRLMLRMVGCEEAADLTQDVFLRVLQTISKFTGRSQFSTWLYRVAVNEALQHLRRRSRKRFAPLVFEPSDRAASPTTQSEEGELLDRALTRLDPELRSLFVLREVERLSYHEIAAVLDLNEGTVGSRLNRARDLLQQYLTELGWRP